VIYLFLFGFYWAICGLYVAGECEHERFYPVSFAWGWLIVPALLLSKVLK
jgi:hypothetical protein